MGLTTTNLPVLALRGLTVFPHMDLTFDVERPISIAALERAMEAEQDIFLVTQREIGVELPAEEDLYQIGTVSHIRQILRLSSGSARVMVEGRRRAACGGCGSPPPISRPTWRSWRRSPLPRRPAAAPGRRRCSARPGTCSASMPSCPAASRRRSSPR